MPEHQQYLFYLCQTEIVLALFNLAYNSERNARPLSKVFLGHARLPAPFLNKL